jgi:predicted nucleotide-binding protein
MPTKLPVADTIECTVHKTQHSIMTSISTNNRLFQDANQAAEIYVKGCVRSVLRQVALESIQQNLIISDDNNLLTVTLLYVHDAQDLCKHVANTWMEELLAIGHVQAACWLDEVVADGNEDLYYQNGTKNGLRRQRTATKRQDLAADLTGNEAEKTKHAMGTQLTTVSRLRSLGAETIWRSLDKDSSSSIDLVAAIHTLDEWARTNQTDWPYGSRIIHKCSQALSSRVAVSKQDEIEIIPKSLWEKQQQQQHNQAKKIRRRNVFLIASEKVDRGRLSTTRVVALFIARNHHRRDLLTMQRTGISVPLCGQTTSKQIWIDIYTTLTTRPQQVQELMRHSWAGW